MRSKNFSVPTSEAWVSIFRRFVENPALPPPTVRWYDQVIYLDPVVVQRVPIIR